MGAADQRKTYKKHLWVQEHWTKNIFKGNFMKDAWEKHWPQNSKESTNVVSSRLIVTTASCALSVSKSRHFMAALNNWFWDTILMYITANEYSKRYSAKQYFTLETVFFSIEIQRSEKSYFWWTHTSAVSQHVSKLDDESYIGNKKSYWIVYSLIYLYF